MIDNHIHQGNQLNIDPLRIKWRRAVDMNDRQLRKMIDGLGGKGNGYPREDGFDITVASEVMAVLCLSSNIIDLKENLAKMIIGYSKEGIPVTAKDLKAEGAMTALLKDALKPNLVQTLEGTPAFIHGGPFANIAHGCNSIMATEMGRNFADYVVTEAGFGADLGAEKFLDIKCRKAGFKPDAVIIVATIRALKYNGGVKKENLSHENLELLEKGLPNLLKHVENITKVFGLPAVVALNKFSQDTDDEVSLVKEKCKELGVNVILSEVWEKGSDGGLEVAKEVINLCESVENDFDYLYDINLPIKDKIYAVASKIYGAGKINYSKKAEKEIINLEKLNISNLPICMAKTQYSLSDDPKKLGRPSNFEMEVTDIGISAGAGFIVVSCGSIMKMPGLPKIPSAEKIDVDENGVIDGLF
jgi:formate--tetrahydrofolate ligase